MGLIRKTLAVGTVGVVNGSSKKQRVARQTLQAVKAQTAAIEAQHRAQVALWRAQNPEAAAQIDTQRAAAAAAVSAFRRLARKERKALMQERRLGTMLAHPERRDRSLARINQELAKLAERKQPRADSRPVWERPLK